MYRRSEVVVAVLIAVLVFVTWLLIVWAPNMLRPWLKQGDPLWTIPHWSFPVLIAGYLVIIWKERVVFSRIGITDSCLYSGLGSQTTVIDLLKPYTVEYRHNGQRRSPPKWLILRLLRTEIEILQNKSSVRLMPIQLVRDGIFDALPADVKRASNLLLPAKNQFREP